MAMLNFRIKKKILGKEFLYAIKAVFCSGSVSFWTSRTRICLSEVWILSSSSKHSKKTLDFYSLVASSLLFIFEE
jgi:hypothetical protein